MNYLAVNAINMNIALMVMILEIHINNNAITPTNMQSSLVVGD